MTVRIAVFLVAVASVVGLAGCNTVAGAGKDIQTAGEGIEKSAENNQ